MEETLFPPSPSWFLPNIVTSREDGLVAYGSKNSIVILKPKSDKNAELSLVRHCHVRKITGVAFSPSNCDESVQNTIVSCSEDGFVKLFNILTSSVVMGHKSHWDQQGQLGKVVSLDWSTANPCYIVSAAENDSLVLWNVLTNITSKFSFQRNIGIGIISCCPHSEKVVAVGGKNGQILIVNLIGSGNILYKLRGHDNTIHSLSWCPIPYNVFNLEKVEEEFLLASACQNKEIYIWRAGTDGKCEAKFQMPTTPLGKNNNVYHSKMGNRFSYTALIWYEPYRIYSTTNFGELIYFDIKSYAQTSKENKTNWRQKSNKQSFNFVKLGHNFHTKGLFAVAGIPVKADIVSYKVRPSKMESKLKLPNQSSYTITEKLEGKHNSYLKWEAILRETSSLLWTAALDKKVVGCELKSSQLELVCNYHTLVGFVHAALSPHDPNMIALGADDGMIRLWNFSDSRDLQMFWQKIQDKVISLAWHPTKDGLLAYGTSEGRVGLIDTNSNKLPTVFKPSHTNMIYVMSWGPPPPSDSSQDITCKCDFDLYVIGDNTLSLYCPAKLSANPINLSKTIPFPCDAQTDVCWKSDFSLMAVGNNDGSISLVEPSQFKIIHTLYPYKKLIQGIAWHPSSTYLDSGLSPFHGYFASGFKDVDSDIRVFNCTKENNEVRVEQVASLKGHYGYVSSVAWSPHISGRLISCSADYSVQIWDVITETPLFNFTASAGGMPLFSMFSPIDPDLVITGCKNEQLVVWKASAQGKTVPALVGSMKKPKEKLVLPREMRNEDVGYGKNGDEEKKWRKNEKKNEDVVVAETVVENKFVRVDPTTKISKEAKMFSRIWKGDANDEMKSCYDLLKTDQLEGNLLFPFLDSNDEFKKSVLKEEESLEKANSGTEFYEVALWNGNLKELLEKKIKSGQLNDFLLSLAPAVSPRLWQEACLSYSKTLLEKKMPRKAASYLIACHKIYEAIQLLVDANLYLEALCIARNRLPTSDPVFKSTVEGYARWLYKTGSYLKACQCYIYLEDYLEVARICGKKCRADYLSLAALAAKKCGSDREPIDATNALFQCFEADDLELAQRICKDHENLTHLSLLYLVYDTIHRLGSGEFELKNDIISHIKESFQIDVNFPTSLPKLFHKYSFYTNKKQVLRIITEEISFALCAQNSDEVLEHLIKALSTCCRYAQKPSGETHPLYNLCVWLSPRGFLSEGDFFWTGTDTTSPKMKSMRAFLCAAIARHLNENECSEEAIKHLDVLKQVKDDLLDAESFKYFKNLIEIEICTKRLLKSRSRITSKKENGIINNTNDCGVTNPETMNGEDAIENGCSESNENENGDIESGENELCPGKGCTNDVDDSEDHEAPIEDCLEEEIEKDMELLNRLRLETETFEKSRISSPNPFPVYSMLKKLCESIPENDTAKSLLADLETKWTELN